MAYENYLRWKQQPLTDRPELSVVIPTYNEAQRIVPTIAAIASYVSDLGIAWELIVSDDGSTDGTPQIVEDLGFANVEIIVADENRGKGNAVRSGLRAARGSYVLFSDADLSTPIEELDRLMAEIDAGADVAIGSRGADGAEEASRSAVRRLVSAVFRTLVRVLFPVGIEDSQCGFKLFTEESAARLVDAQTIEGFSFDLELLWVANRIGLEVAEVPVHWVDAPGSKVDPAREAVRFLADMVRIRRRHRGLRPRGSADRTGLRIAVVTPLPPSKLTLNEYGYHLVRQLTGKADVHDVVVLCDDSVEDVPAPLGASVDRCWSFDSVTNPVRLWRAVRRHRPDVVLFNAQFATFGAKKVPAALGLFTPAILRFTGTPTVVLLHNLVDTVDLDAAGFTSNRLMARLLAAIGGFLTRVLLLADRVAVTIPAYVDILRDRYGADNVYLAPHGSFGDAEPAPTTVPARPRFLTFGKFGTYKKVDGLVAAYRMLVESGHADLELVVAGTDSPNCPGYLDDVARANQDLPGLTFTGYVAEDDVAGLFRSATAVVFPYTGTTGSSGPLHQAGEHGRAAVLPAIGDFLDVIGEEGYAAETFEPGDVLSLRDALERVLTDDVRRDAIAGQNAAAAAGLPIGEVADLHVLHLRATA